MAYSGYPAEAPKQPERSGTVTAVGVLGIVVGGLGLLSTPMNLIYMATGWRAAGPMGPAMWENDAFRVYMSVSTVLGALLSALYIVAGVGLLRVRPWAWGLTVGLIAFAMVSQVVGGCVIVPQMASIVSDAMPAMPQGGPDMSFLKPLMYVAGGIGMAISLAVLTTLLVLLTRPPVRQAFARAKSAA